MHVVRAHKRFLPAAAAALEVALLGMGGCRVESTVPASQQKAPPIRAETHDIVVTRGPIILRSPGVPAVVIRTPEDGPADPLPSEILGDPDLTTMIVPPGTVVTQNAGGNPKSITLIVDEAHAGDTIRVTSDGNLVFNISEHARKGPTASQPAQATKP
jgi:hypothetical protein